MNQKTMFDEFDAQALCRPTDKQTSHDAAIRIALTQKLNQKQRQFVLRLGWHPRSTANEIAASCAHEFGGMPETYRKRAGELERAGWIRVVGSRVCRITGTRASVYEVVK